MERKKLGRKGISDTAWALILIALSLAVVYIVYRIIIKLLG